MRKVLLAAVVALIGLVPLTAQAQQAPAAKPGDVFGLNSSQVIAIGLGVLGGSIVAEGVVGAPVWAGAAAGALIGNWYYSQQGDAPGAAAVRRAQAMADEAKVYFISATDSASTWLRQ
jgi:hypothetical protein